MSVTCYVMLLLIVILLRCQDECSFVSLRDVDRTLQVTLWFYYHAELFELMNEKAAAETNPETDEEEREALQVVIQHMSYVLMPCWLCNTLLQYVCLFF